VLALATLTRRRGNLAWDGLIRASGVLGLLAIPATLRLPDFGALSGFVLVTMWLNGPLAPFFPASYEPVLMLYGRMYSPLLVATCGMAATLYIEYLNYYLYRRLLHTRVLDPLRQSAAVNWIIKVFQRSPFFAVWLCAWSPLPYWSVRFLSPVSGYPVSKHLWATFLGRFPRLWFFAALGLWWHASGSLLLGISVGSVVLAVAVWALHAGRRPPRAQEKGIELAPSADGRAADPGAATAR
jgi:uncharacterized membrane protein YdjX (TVP38/TMEM64 family)